MAEEKNLTLPTSATHDDYSALAYVLQHVRGASPTSVTPLELDTVEE